MSNANGAGGHELDPLQILQGKPAPPAVFLFDGKPPGELANATVEYVGVHPDMRQRSMDKVLGAVAAASGNPERAELVAGLGLHAVLPVLDSPELSERPAFHLVMLRNQLGHRFVRRQLASMAATEATPTVTDTEAVVTIQQLYDRLENVHGYPWKPEGRRTVAILLAEPGFNKLLITRLLTKAATNPALRTAGAMPEALSVDDFIDRINEIEKPTGDTLGAIMAEYKKIKDEFVHVVLGWAGGNKTIFDSPDSTVGGHRRGVATARSTETIESL